MLCICGEGGFHIKVSELMAESTIAVMFIIAKRSRWSGELEVLTKAIGLFLFLSSRNKVAILAKLLTGAPE